MSGIVPVVGELDTKTKRPVKVYCRTIFLKIGEVDSKNEKFTAEAFCESFWEDDEIYKQLIQSKNAMNSNLINF